MSFFFGWENGWWNDLITGLTVDAARRAAGFVRGDDVIHKIFTLMIRVANYINNVCKFKIYMCHY